jgi:hypothetical protein
MSPESQRHRYTCDCRHEFQVFGGGRHRRYFELEDSLLADPLMLGICPDCRRALPGKSAG